jgi:hypothetical protein
MTFTEAAAHVLRLVGKPLHYKEITDVAIERDLLSHVGKSPEVTMGARLAAVVKKDPKDNPLVRVKPGVFALRDWDQAVIDSGLAATAKSRRARARCPTRLPPWALWRRTWRTRMAMAAATQTKPTMMKTSGTTNALARNWPPPRPSCSYPKTMMTSPFSEATPRWRPVTVRTPPANGVVGAAAGVADRRRTRTTGYPRTPSLMPHCSLMETTRWRS